jgi:hypothetical protein
MDFNEVRHEGVKWIELAQNRVHWRGFVNNYGFHKSGKFLDQLSKFSAVQGGLWSVELEFLRMYFTLFV